MGLYVDKFFSVMAYMLHLAHRNSFQSPPVEVAIICKIICMLVSQLWFHFSKVQETRFALMQAKISIQKYWIKRKTLFEIDTASCWSDLKTTQMQALMFLHKLKSQAIYSQNCLDRQLLLKKSRRKFHYSLFLQAPAGLLQALY